MKAGERCAGANRTAGPRAKSISDGGVHAALTERCSGATMLDVETAAPPCCVAAHVTGWCGWRRACAKEGASPAAGNWRRRAGDAAVDRRSRRKSERQARRGALGNSVRLKTGVVMAKNGAAAWASKAVRITSSSEQVLQNGGWACSWRNAGTTLGQGQWLGGEQQHMHAWRVGRMGGL